VTRYADRSCHLMQVAEALELLDNSDVSAWQPVHKHEGMTVSRTEIVDAAGEVIDRTRVAAKFRGATAKEVCEFFHSPDGKFAFDSTLDTINVCCQELHLCHTRVCARVCVCVCVCVRVRVWLVGGCACLSKTVQPRGADHSDHSDQSDPYTW
jgi:hypothetical protein